MIISPLNPTKKVRPFFSKGGNLYIVRPPRSGPACVIGMRVSVNLVS